MKLYDAATTRRIDDAAGSEWGLCSDTLMQRAGSAAFDELITAWPAARGVLVLAGAGNNAGDGYVVARAALAAGLSVCVAQLLPPPKTGPAAAHHAALLAAGARFLDDRAVLDWLAHNPDGDAGSGMWVVVDAVFGSGLTRPVEAPIADVFAACASAGRPILALDIPSGICADTGAVLGTALPADRTVTFIVPKVGLFTGEALAFVGDLSLADLGVPARVAEAFAPRAEGFSQEVIAPALTPRRRTAHKGDFGHVLVVGGYEGMPGAALLAATAAARGGAGLVSVATWPAHAASLVTACPSLMVQPVATARDLNELLARASVVVVGPGLGRAPWSEAMFDAVLAVDKPLVIDADALNAVASGISLPPGAGAPRVMTPHPGEAARLLDIGTNEIARDRLGAAQAIADRFDAVCVLKGAGTVVVGPSGLPGICLDGNPGLATGGTGDVLAGLIGAMLAQSTFDRTAEAVVRLSVALHARAGDLAARNGARGMLASDLLPEIRRLLNPEIHGERHDS